MENNKRITMIGGQAVIEGVMMKSPHNMATAVRTEKGDILLETEKIAPVKNKFLKLPLIRGVVNFVLSLVSGTKILMRSAEVFGEGEPTKFEKWCAEKLKINVMSVISFFSLIISLGLAIALFILAPQYIRIWILKGEPNPWAKNFLEGGIKLVIFIVYILLSSLLKDIRRTFMYHGAEHKTIACYEKGLALTPENAKTCSRFHNRCGTTFIFFVMFISIVVFACFESIVTIDNRFYRVLCKIAMLPLVAGLSYELLKGLAKTNSPIFLPIKAPGLLLQRLTTREPDEKMLEVAITAFKTVLEMDKNPLIEEVKFKMPKRCNSVLLEVTEKLAKNGITEKAEAEWILSICLNEKRDNLKSDRIVTDDEFSKIEKIVNERITGRPLWYCIGDTEFFGYKIKVDERVLIPRPETEILVETAKTFLTDKSAVLDLCSGSGAVAIAIKKETDAFVTASDISNDAISLAKENATFNNADIEFLTCDLFDGIGERKFDCIVSNPPYIKSCDIDGLQNEVKNFEPHIALDGGEDGLDFYRKIAEKAPLYLNKNGILILEIGHNQAESVVGLLSGFSSVEVIKDYENIDRIIKAEL